MGAFQSTSPVRGTTDNSGNIQLTSEFQSTSPVRGTTIIYLYLSIAIYISIHVPREGDDWHCYHPRTPIRISIHVPREGDDEVYGYIETEMVQFQSTSPVRGTTRPPPPPSPAARISIHVPREGDDSKGAQKWCSFGKGKREITGRLAKCAGLLNKWDQGPGAFGWGKGVRTCRGNMFAWTSRSENQGAFGLVGGFAAEMLHLFLVGVAQIVESQAVLFRIHDG